MSKKLNLYRKSGSPVNLSDQKAYAEAWKAFFDKADARAKAKHNSGAFTDQYAVLIQRYLRFGERQLFKQFNVEVQVDVPKSSAAWTALIQTYEDCPIMVARSADGKSIVGILMDEGFG